MGDQEAAPVESTVLKNEGNALLAAGQTDAAIEKYTAALGCCPEALDDLAAVILSNRSMCRFNLGAFNEALMDAENAVEMKVHYAKAYFRLGKARRALGDEAGAAAALKEAVRLTPKVQQPPRQQTYTKKPEHPVVKKNFLAGASLYDDEPTPADRRHPEPTTAERTMEKMRQNFASEFAVIDAIAPLMFPVGNPAVNVRLTLEDGAEADRCARASRAPYIGVCGSVLLERADYASMLGSGRAGESGGGSADDGGAFAHAVQAGGLRIGFRLWIPTSSPGGVSASSPGGVSSACVYFHGNCETVLQLDRDGDVEDYLAAFGGGGGCCALLAFDFRGYE